MNFGDEIRSGSLDTPSGIGGNSDVIWASRLGTDNDCVELSPTDLSIVRSGGVSSGGIGGDAGYIWGVDTGFAFVVEKHSVDFSVVRGEAAPTDNPRDIGGDENTIWYCDDGAEQRVSELSIVDFSEIRNGADPGGGLPAGIGGKADVIWECNADDELYELSTTDFSVVQTGGTPASKPGGAGGDRNALWHVDYDENKAYELSTREIKVPRMMDYYRRRRVA